jgi:hypothetical protein
MKLITAFFAFLVAKDAAVLDDAVTDMALLDQAVNDIGQLDQTVLDHPKRGAAYNAPGAVNPLASTYDLCF